MDAEIAYFLELRVRLRGRREAVAIVDRCLVLIARAADADPATLVGLNREVERLADDLALRFGAPKTLLLH